LMGYMVFSSVTKTGMMLARQRRLLVGIFFGGLLLLGLLLVRDYGISIDERQDRRTGMVSLRYVSEKVWPSFVANHADFANNRESLKDYMDRDYGVSFQLPVTWLEQVLDLESWQHAYWLRHLCTFLVSLGGVAALYQLARRRFGDWRLGLLGALLLVLSPRLFAEFFYNDKDVVFMAFFVIATNTSVAFVARPSWRRAAWHALACAFAIDARIMGVLLPIATLALVGLQAAHGAYSQRGPQTARQVGGYLLLLMGLVVLLWPYLWAAPLTNFGIAFKNMSHFRWGGMVLYRGELVFADQLPWHYAPVWIGITTPLLYLAGFGVGAALILRQLVRRGWRLYATEAEWQDLFFLGLVLAPLLAVIGLHSVLYDGWRQVYFVYPALLLVALRGLVAVGRWQPWAAWRRLCYGVLVLVLLTTAGQMVLLHPLQNVYFNALAGKDIELHYEVDYWQLAYYPGLQWIMKHDNRPHIVVAAQWGPIIEADSWLLPSADRDRIEITADPAKADYYVCTHRDHPQAYKEYPVVAKVLRRDGMLVLSIFKLSAIQW
jgi:uncharacterized membrane protein